MKSYFWIFGILFFIYIAFNLKDLKCSYINKSKNVKIERTCFIVPDIIYNRLNHFCGSHSHWIQLSIDIKRPNKFNNTDNLNVIRRNFWGTKFLECGDNSTYQDFNDSDVFLLTLQDTSLLLYNGALSEIRFGRDIFSFNLENSRDVGVSNRKIKYHVTGIDVNYLLSYQEVNTSVLREFQNYISFDKDFTKRFKNSNYRLINKSNGQCIASIRYKEYGKRFYFDVHNIK